MTGDVRLTSVLVSRYPCCKGRVRLTAHDLQGPRERYRRTCPRCGRLWAVERVQVKGPGASLGGNTLGGQARIDRLDFREVVQPRTGIVWRLLSLVGFRPHRFTRFRRVYV